MINHPNRSKIVAKVEISPEMIANLMTTAIESGDPVTTASKGGWCSGIYWKSKESTPPDGYWYSEPKTWANGFQIEVIEVDDEETGHETAHKLDKAKVAKGLSMMAACYGHLFSQITTDNVDAPCADIFLQCCLFGGEKYA